MSKDKFVDSNLVKIRDRLSETVAEDKEIATPAQDQSGNSVSSNPKNIRETTVANERDWKKAVFRRWDEFKNTKKDIVTRLAERIAAIPREICDLDSHAAELKAASDKYKRLLEEVDTLDDSDWNRHNFTSELAAGMKKLENVRIEFMMLSSKSSSKQTPATLIEKSGYSDSFIHELNSLSFKQCFRIGFAFFMPLILGIILATLIWGIFYYISLH